MKKKHKHPNTSIIKEDAPLKPINNLSTIEDSHITVDLYDYQRCNQADCSCDRSCWEKFAEQLNCSHIHICSSNSKKRMARLHISKSDIDFNVDDLISAKLIFKTYLQNSYDKSAEIKIGNAIYSQYGTNDITVDITDEYKNTLETLSFDMYIDSDVGDRDFEAPILKIAYTQMTEDPIQQIFSIG